MQHLQGQDMSKLGAMQDLVRGVNKIIGKNRVTSSTTAVTNNISGAEQDAFESQIRKGYVYLSKRIFKDAKEAFENAIRLIEKCGRAYIGLMLAEAEEDNIDDYLEHKGYKASNIDKLELARSFADKKCLDELEEIDAKIDILKNKDKKDYFINLLINQKWDEAKEFLNKEEKNRDKLLELYKEVRYNLLVDLINSKIDIKRIDAFDSAIEGFNELNGYKDSKEKIQQCYGLKAKLINDWDDQCIECLNISYPEEISLKTLNNVAKKLNANKASLKYFNPCSDVIKNAFSEIQDNGYKFIESKSYNLINTFNNIYECVQLRTILSSLNNNSYFKKDIDAICEKENYIRDVENQIKKKKVKKRLKISGIICAVLAVLATCTGVIFGIKANVDEVNRNNDRNNTYNAALTAMNNGNYNKAIYYYNSLGNYKDSQNKIKICYGLVYLDYAVRTGSEETTITGIKKIVSAGEKVDVNYETENDPNIRRALYTSSNSGNRTETIDSTEFTFYKPIWGGYTFLNWSPTNVSYKDNRTSLDLLSNWSLNAYSITYNLDGGTNPSSNPSTYTVEDSITLASPTKSGYTFQGWYSDFSFDNKIEVIKSGSYGDVNLYAKWSANKNNLSVTSEDESKGTVSIVSGDGYSDESITVKATQVGDCIFIGWYNNDAKVSDENPYTFVMPANDYSLVARFMTKAEAEERNKKLGIIPAINEEEKTLTYGLYPQSHVNDENIIAALNNLTAESNGWYLYNDEYYVKKSANPCSSSYTFDDGTTIVSGTEYWFKCEPIEWKILTSNNGTYSLVSTKLLDAHRYDDDSNNYMNSEIRLWLNDNFLNTAFNLDSSLIQTTLVDNSASTTYSSSNSYACANTNDKVYLLSYKDYSNATYFANDSARMCKPTDYALASYCYGYNGNGWYWTRSPYSDLSYYAWHVDDDGYLYNFRVYSSNYGVRPALTINL